MSDQSASMANIPAAIATVGLAKRYQHHFAIKDLDLTVHSGATLGILGSNGSGKSSLLKLLATLEVPTRGQIYFNGELVIPGTNQLRFRKSIGYLPEYEHLDPNLLVTDYLNYFASLYQIPTSKSKIRIYEALEWVNLTHKHKNLIGYLSQGEKKRLSLARAIIHEPTILLLDNPFPSLDKTVQDQLDILLTTLKEAAITVVVTATSPNHLIRTCTEIRVIEYGYLTNHIELHKLNLKQPNCNNLNSHKPNLENQIQQIATFLNQSMNS